MVRLSKPVSMIKSPRQTVSTAPVVTMGGFRIVKLRHAL